VCVECSGFRGNLNSETIVLDIGTFSSRSCRSWSRRAFLRAGLTLPGLVIPALLGTEATTRALASVDSPARSVLVFWLGGGPSHLDLCDPKPKAPLEYRGPFSPIATRTPGLTFTELLPQMAQRSDRFSVIRSNVNFDGDHLIAESIGLTGAPAGSTGYQPNFGSIIARQRGSANMPSFVSLARGPIGDGRGPMPGYGGGIWGQAYDPFMLSCSERGEVEIPDLRLFDGLNPRRLADRRTVLAGLDAARRQLDSRRLGQWDQLHDRAHALLTSDEARQAFDLSREPEVVRQAYGQTSVGQSCLLGRRLVEAGVPYVQVNWSQFVEVLYPFSDYGWDTHADNFGLLADWHGPLLDQVFSTLLDDLEARGLLRTTLVICLGEFGRTPRINSIGSRDHWHQCYFSVWAGAGVQPGRVVGQSDPRGEFPVSKPVTPAMVGATILDRMGITTEMRAELGVLRDGTVIDELF